MTQLKTALLLIMLCASGSVFASQHILGKYSTVDLGECTSEIHFLKNGKGIFTDYCEGGNVHGNKVGFTWRMDKGVIHAKINGNEETFKFQDQLSCSYINKKGSSNGLIGMDLYFWKMPIDCK